MENPNVNPKDLRPLFFPRSIAIIGASADPNKPGGQPVYSLKKNRYPGEIFPVNPHRADIDGIPCHPSIEAVPRAVDLAIVAVAAPLVPETLRRCVQKGVKAAIVFSSGFAEVGAEGARLQQEIAAIAAGSGMVLCGPNCMGIFNAANNMTAGFAVTDLPEKLLIPNFFGFVTQSGGFGGAIYAMASDRGIGFTYFISSGNEADLTFADYLLYLIEDKNTRAIGGYLEGVRDGRKLVRAAGAALDAEKPILLIKTGRFDAAVRAASSHTGAMTGSERVYSSFFRQKGIVRVEGIEELTAILSLLAAGRLPKGNRVAIIATSGGSGVLLSDKCAEAGLDVAKLSGETRAALDRLLPGFASSANPVDITSQIMTHPELFQMTAEIVLNDPGVDMLILCHWANRRDKANPPEEVAKICALAQKPVMVLVWGTEKDALEDLHYLRWHGVPAARELDFVVRSLAALAGYHERVQFHRRFANFVPSFAPDRDAAAKILAAKQPGDRLSEAESKAVLRAYGIPATREAVAHSAAEAARLAAEIGFPAALKIDSPDIPHKTEAGGVALDLTTPEEVMDAYGRIMDAVRDYRPDARINGVLVQEMLGRGTEVIAGISRDPAFGPVVLFGLGGIFVEALEDVAMRVAPLHEGDAREMIKEIKGHKVLAGMRGRAPADEGAVVD
ncbi:MAG: acetate--CoA ligase family protein, partial [Firmicutes bacterium]|nr:acetate--CoA ligase family protein [Bacillota bacterium]